MTCPQPECDVCGRPAGGRGRCPKCAEPFFLHTPPDWQAPPGIEPFDFFVTAAIIVSCLLAWLVGWLVVSVFGGGR